MTSQPPISPAANRPSQTTGPVHWEYHPLTSGTWLVVALVVSAVVVRAVVVAETQDSTLGLFACLLVLVAGWRMLIPAKYEIGPTGVKVQTLWRRKRVGWRDLDRIEIGRGGVFLVPIGSRWSWWRGLYLPWFQQRDEVLFALRHYGQRYLPVESADLTRTVSANGVMLYGDSTPVRIERTEPK